MQTIDHDEKERNTASEKQNDGVVGLYVNDSNGGRVFSDTWILDCCCYLA